MRDDAYINKLDRMEANIAPVDVAGAAASIAISLRRIADSLEAARPSAVINADDLDVDALRGALSESQVGAIVSEHKKTRIARRVPITFSLQETEFAPLGQMPPGLYLCGHTLILKTQYSTAISAGGYKPDCYIVDGGEYFAGGVPEAQVKDLLVKPVSYDFTRK